MTPRHPFRYYNQLCAGKIDDSAKILLNVEKILYEEELEQIQHLSSEAVC